MNKKFLLAAVMGCTMALGFTACSDDDENDNEGTCSQRYVLEFLNTEDTTDCQYIESAYQKVTNSTSMQHCQYLTIEGKDSLTCLSQFQKLMEEVESQIGDKNFQTNTCVYGYTSGLDSIYSVVYGPSENSLYTYRTEVNELTKQYKNIIVGGGTVSDFGTLPCVEMGVTWFGEAGYGNYFRRTTNEYNKKWEYLCSDNINMGTGFCVQLDAYLYCGEGNNPGDITDVRILDNGLWNQPPTTLTFDGRTYTVVKHNLNEGLGGNYLYVCYTRDNYENRYLTGKQATCYRHKYLWNKKLLHSWLDISQKDIQGTLDKYSAQGYIPQIVPMIIWGGNSYIVENAEAKLHMNSSKNNNMIWVVCYKKY